MSSIGYSADYGKGYSDGYRCGFLEATQQLPILAARLLNPTPVILSGVTLLDIKESAPTVNQQLKECHGQSAAASV